MNELEFYDYNAIWELLESYNILPDHKRKIKYFFRKIADNYYIQRCIERDEILMRSIDSNLGRKSLEKVSHLFDTKIEEIFK